MSSNFDIDDLIWAKMKGYSPWPAQIIEPLPNMKIPKTKEPVHCVVFFGTRQQIAFVAESDILSFEKGKKKCDEKKKIGGDYKKAVEEMYSIAATLQKSAIVTNYPSAYDGHTSEETNQKVTQVNQGTPKEKLNRTSKRGTKTLFNPEQNQKLGSSNKRTFDEPSSESEKKQRTTEPSFRKPIPLQVAKKTIKGITPSVSCPVENVKADANSGRSINLAQIAPLLNPVPVPLPDPPIICEGGIKVSLPSTNIGFIGLGAMGSNLLMNLIKSRTKRSITIWNRTIKRCTAYARYGVYIAKSPAEVLTRSDIVFSCVTDRSAVKEVVRGTDGILSALRENPGKGYVELTTIDPDFSQSICKDITFRRGRYLEVPMLGKKENAKSGTLLLLASGDKDLFKACLTCFQDMGQHIFFLREVGNASKMSIIVNMVLATCFVSIAEAMNLAKQSGISQKNVVEIMELGDLNCPALINQGNAILNLMNNPKAKYDNIPVEHMQRNMHLAIEIANQYSQPTPTIDAVNDVFKLIRRQDAIRECRSDISEIYKALLGEQRDGPFQYE